MSPELYAKCSCQSCGNNLEFPVEAAGTTIDCPHCKQPTQLNLMPLPSDSAPGAVSAVELLAGFQGPVAPTPLSFLYRLGLVLVTVMMVLLPLVYFAMIAAAAYGVYSYGEHFSYLLKSPSGRSSGKVYAGQLLLYFAPLFIGAVLVFFMIKPLFARRPRQAQPLAMNPAVEKTLYAFIAKICDSVGAPMPRRIDLDCQLNASAGFRRGVWSLFGKDDLVLTIGLPLVAGLNLQQFAGVMAHEFGHFTQGFGMRLSYVIRTVNAWFARVVYERDAWDMRLAELAENAGDIRLTIIVWLTQAAVGFSRLILMGLMYLGHGVSCFLLRQMEYDADSYEIKLAGSGSFESTAQRLRIMNEAAQKAYKEMRTAWNINHKLPDNFPAYLMQQQSTLPPRRVQNILDTLGMSQTGVFDTHPSDGDRIRRARQAGEPGLFHLQMPASVLFSNFDVAARQVTQLHYTDDLGIPFDPVMLRPVEAAQPQTA